MLSDVEEGNNLMLTRLTPVATLVLLLTTVTQLWCFRQGCATIQHCRAKCTSGPQLHVSNSACETTRWPPTKDWQYPIPDKPFGY